MFNYFAKSSFYSLINGLNWFLKLPIVLLGWAFGFLNGFNVFHVLFNRKKQKNRVRRN